MDTVKDAMRIFPNERTFMKTSKPKLTYNIQIQAEVPSRSLFEKIQEYLYPYFINGTDNACTFETLSELWYDIVEHNTDCIDKEVRDFIVSVFRCHCKKRAKWVDVEIGDVVFYCSK